MKQVLPRARIVPLTVAHPIFDSFFHIATLTGMTHPDMEWSRQGWYAVNLSNDAYELATNCIVYGLTH